MEIVKIDTSFREILYEIEQSTDAYFITGRAGTGKSTLLRQFCKTTRKKHVVLAPTGIAALNVGGQTIHSFFKFPARIITKDTLKIKRRKSFKKLECIVVDEISMVRADLLDGMNYFLQYQRENTLPFGGVQLLFFGDLFQLPPVIGKGDEKEIYRQLYDSAYFFDAKVMQSLSWQAIELKQVFRQKDPFFVSLLDKIRLNQADEEDLNYINEICTDYSANERALTLTSINYKANLLNSKKLKELPGDEQVFLSMVEGDFSPSYYPTPEVLRLKTGAQVIFLRNHPEGHFVNGTLGTIAEFDTESVKVEVQQANQTRIIDVEKVTWERIRYIPSSDAAKPFKEEVIGTFTQFPLKLAWAMTIHKSQGQTFDQVNIDLGTGAFEYGQTYVALSRCRSLAGIALQSKIQLKDIMVDDRVIDFYRMMGS